MRAPILLAKLYAQVICSLIYICLHSLAKGYGLTNESNVPQEPIILYAHEDTLEMIAQGEQVLARVPYVSNTIRNTVLSFHNVLAKTLETNVGFMVLAKNNMAQTIIVSNSLWLLACLKGADYMRFGLLRLPGGYDRIEYLWTAGVR